jgi:hypothetical protein
MTLFLVLAVLLPWSVWRQMHEHFVTKEGLIKLPVIFAIVGACTVTSQNIPANAAAVIYIALSLGLSIALGIWRGAVIPIWLNKAGEMVSRGNKTTLSLWVALVAAKFAMGTVASVTGWVQGAGAGEVFLFLGLSFMVQNFVVWNRKVEGRTVGARINEENAVDLDGPRDATHSHHREPAYAGHESRR